MRTRTYGGVGRTGNRFPYADLADLQRLEKPIRVMVPTISQIRSPGEFIGTSASVGRSYSETESPCCCDLCSVSPFPGKR